MMIVQHNLMAMNANRQLGITGGVKRKNTERLSSGYRINRAADDAACLSISEKMRWQVNGLNKASNNCEDGISLCQVAEGALSEVHRMLDRIKELSVQAANDTNTLSDRQAIQREINQLKLEIDRIGDTTSFNTKPLFQGSEQDIIDTETGDPVSLQDIPISDFSISDVSLNKAPFTSGSDRDRLALSATINGNYNVNGATYGLVFGDGSTSHNNFRYSYTDGTGHTRSGEAQLNQMPITSTNINDATGKYERTYSYAPEAGVSFEIKQTIQVEPNDGTSQYYNISYEVKNTGTKNASYDLMHNVDTAYRNNDSCEEYFMGGTKLDKFHLYTKESKYLSKGNPNVSDNISDALDFSVYNTAEYRLPFSENVKIPDSDKLRSVLVGDWSQDTYRWQNVDSLGAGLGSSTDGRDKAFSLIWSDTVNAGATSSGMSYKHGIKAAASDNNVNTVPTTGTADSKLHVAENRLWIQSGATNLNGFFINVDEMNSTVLGLSRLDVTSFHSASEAIKSTDEAIDMISSHRAKLGAQYNRLEKAVLVDDNTSENTQAAESRIRDTDMAREMVEFSKHNILEQAGTSMLAQANQTPQGVLSLLG